MRSRFQHIMYLILLPLLPMTLSVVAHGQNPVSATVSSTRVAVNEMFYLTISANGSDVKEPDLTPLVALGIQLGTPSVQSSTSIQSINGQTSVMQSRVWRYPATVSREGAITLPRISVRVDGQEYFTQPITLEVTRSVAMPGPPSSADNQITVDDLAFVRTVTDKTTVYQGEALTLRLKLYILDGNYVSVEGPRNLPMPDTEGFIPGPEWQNRTQEQLYGRAYEVTEFCRVLYPAMPGDLFIGAWQWQGAVRWHDARRRVQTAPRMFVTESIPISVIPLPDPPPNFSGAVGKFRLEAQLPQRDLLQGTPVRFTVAIVGEGNPTTVSPPQLPSLSWAHVSGPETETQQQNNSPEIRKIFSYLITPLEPGEQSIPPISYTYFAPLIKNYKTESTQEFPVNVAAAVGSTTLVAVGGSVDDQRNRIEVRDDGILPIITESTAMIRRPPHRIERLTPLALASPIVTVVIYSLLYLFFIHRSRVIKDRGYARRLYARKRFNKALDAAQAAQDLAEALARALTSYIADMANVNEAGLTSADVEDLLRTKGIDEETVLLVVKLLRACERVRYAGRSSDVEENTALVDAARQAVEKLHAAFQERQT